MYSYFKWILKNGKLKSVGFREGLTVGEEVINTLYAKRLYASLATAKSGFGLQGNKKGGHSPPNNHVCEDIPTNRNGIHVKKYTQAR